VDVSEAIKEAIPKRKQRNKGWYWVDDKYDYG